MPKERDENFSIELLKFALIALIIAVPIRVFVAKPFVVSGESMYPTFDSGQYLIVDELTYHFEQPQRNDVIIMRYPLQPSTYFIKRIVGLPGETLHITDNAVYLVNKDGSETLLPESFVVNKGNGPDRRVTLGPGEYFVMGDNRPNSSDSRVWGDLPAQDIVGRAFVRLLPFSQLSLFPGSVPSQAAIPAASSQ